MRDFLCPNCGQRLAFENSVCLRCGNPVGFDLDSREFVLVAADGTAVNDPSRRMCANLAVAACNWVAPADSPLCASCVLTRTRPADVDALGLAEFVPAEAAKRRLIMELTELDLPIIGRDRAPDSGLAFDLLSSANEQVMTGHDNGVITLNLAESDDVHREQLRVSMAEPYRTLLGHFRHEVSHYYSFVLAGAGENKEAFDALFGDQDTDYQAALDRHYSQGAPAGWESDYVSSYATMHPSEDWAETMAHYLHIRDTIDTAAAFGNAPAGATLRNPLASNPGFDRLIEIWIPLTWSLNMLNRSMGQPDLYPFVLPPRVLEKMRLVHRLITGYPAAVGTV